MEKLELAFTICAAVGGLLFIIRLILQFVAGVDDISAEIADGDIDVSDSDVGFRLMSFQGLTAFFMMFGLVGRALIIEYELGALASLGGATAAGVVTVWLMAKVFLLMKRLQSSGTLDVRHAVGQEGTVYLTIPAGETGKVSVTVDNRLRVMDAVSDEKEEIVTGALVKVLRVTGDSVLVVTKL